MQSSELLLTCINNVTLIVSIVYFHFIIQQFILQQSFFYRGEHLKPTMPLKILSIM